MNKPLKLERPKPEKFKTIAQVEERLKILRAMKFNKGQRGMGNRDNEIKVLEKRLKQMQNPGLDFGFYEAAPVKKTLFD